MLLTFTACGEKKQESFTSISVSSEEDTQGSKVSDETYNNLFDRSIVHNIDIEISEEDLLDQNENPLDKTKYRADVIIDGERFENVSFATKGSSSLIIPYTNGSTRFPYKLNFGKYEKKQSYYGLDKLNLSGFYSDPSCMKDWLAFRIMEESGISAPLTSYVWLTINGEDRGLYLALEEIGDSWMARTGRQTGELYKPESPVSNMNFGGAEDAHIIKEKGLLAYFLERIERMGSPADTGSALVYLDDDAESYPDIFDNAETKVNDDDKTRLIDSLKMLSDPERCKSVLDTEEVIRYFAAHNFVLSSDSYTGLPAHNYYLCEEDGVMSIFPWDYNSAFGENLGKLHPELTRENIINWLVDEPLYDTNPQERPLWAWIPADEESRKQYHAVLDELLKNYFESGRFEEEINRMYSLIEPYKAKDPTSFSTMEETLADFQKLKAFCMERAAAVRSQIGEDRIQ